MLAQSAQSVIPKLLHIHSCNENKHKTQAFLTKSHELSIVNF